MKQYYYIAIVVLSLFFSGRAEAQGDVVVHSDPRLSLMLKRPHNVEQASVASMTHKQPAKKTVHTPPAVLSHTTSGKAAILAETLPTASASKLPRYIPAATAGNSIKAAAVPAPATNKPIGDKAPPPQAVVTSATRTLPPPMPLPSIGGHAAGWEPVHHERATVKSGKGYRVQIYNGPDRNKAIEIKREFMRHFPGVHTYLTYKSPCFRVKVGDFRNRSDAVGMYKEANSIYSPTMIVPDIIIVSTF